MTAPKGDLARIDQAATVVWSPEQTEILKRDLGIKTDEHLAYFAQVCTHKQLDPFLGEIVPVYYGNTMVIQETVEGLRTIAERSGLYGGFDGPYWCGPDLDWKPVWLSDGPPAAARYFVRRKDWPEMVPGVARWASSAQMDRNGNLMPLWKDRPDEMLGKTAETRALKRAFPKEFARAGINIRDLTDAQRVVIEARRVGLDDDERHALVADVTDGRTDSTRDLTDDETLAVRNELARRRPNEPVDPDTGELHKITTVVQAGPGGSNHLLRCTCGWQVTAGDADKAKTKEAQHALKAYLNALQPEQRQELRRWMAERTILDLDATTSDDLAAIETELDKRGW
jgi:hypothetical protein